MKPVRRFQALQALQEGRADSAATLRRYMLLPSHQAAQSLLRELVKLRYIECTAVRPGGPMGTNVYGVTPEGTAALAQFQQ